MYIILVFDCLLVEDQDDMLMCLCDKLRLDFSCINQSDGTREGQEDCQRAIPHEYMTIPILGFSATLPSKFNLFNQWMNPMEQETWCVGRWIWNFLPTMQGFVYRDSLEKDPKRVHLFPKRHQLGLLEFILFLFILIFFSLFLLPLLSFSIHFHTFCFRE